LRFLDKLGMTNIGYFNSLIEDVDARRSS